MHGEKLPALFGARPSVSLSLNRVSGYIILCSYNEELPEEYR